MEGPTSLSGQENPTTLNVIEVWDLITSLQKMQGNVYHTHNMQSTKPKLWETLQDQ